MAQQKMNSKLSEWIKQGFFLYKNNFLVLIVVTFLAYALSSFLAALLTGPMLMGVVAARESAIAQILIMYLMLAMSNVAFSILGGPLLAGVALVTLGLLDRKKPNPNIGNLFKGFHYFLQAFLFILVWSVINVILQGLAPLILSPVLLSVVPAILSIVIGTLTMFGLFLIVDQQRTFLQASMESIKRARQHFWLFAAVVLVAGAISLAGLLACGVGVVVTAPIYLCVLAVVYRDVYKQPAKV